MNSWSHVFVCRDSFQCSCMRTVARSSISAHGSGWALSFFGTLRLKTFHLGMVCVCLAWSSPLPRYCCCVDCLHFDLDTCFLLYFYLETGNWRFTGSEIRCIPCHQRPQCVKRKGPKDPGEAPLHLAQSLGHARVKARGVVGRIGGMLRYAGWLHAQGVGRMLCAACDDRRQYRSPTIVICKLENGQNDVALEYITASVENRSWGLPAWPHKKFRWRCICRRHSIARSS